MVFLVYIDDCIVFGPDNQVTNLYTCSQHFTVDDQGNIGDFLGIQVQKQDDRSIRLTQPQLIDSIIKDLHLQSRSNPKKTPAVTTHLLHKDSDGPEMTLDFHYHSIIGKLNFLEKSTWPDISVSMHQCARFSESPKKSHAEGVKCIGHYLLSLQDKGLIIRPNKQWHFDCWVDANFAGNWHQKDAHIDPMTSKSCSGWTVRFAGALITWALSTSLSEVIPMMGMLKEAREQGLQVNYLPPQSPLHSV